MSEVKKDWLIKRRGYFYRPDKAGYTARVPEAGRYTEEDARREASIEPDVMSAHHISEFQSELAQAVAALSHPAPDVPSSDELEHIRARHEAAERNNRWDDIERYGDDAHADRATLLAFVDSLKFKAEISVASSDLDEMRAREAVWPGGLDRNDPLTPFGEACNDRATLLRLLDAARAELREVREAAGVITGRKWVELLYPELPDYKPVSVDITLGDLRRLAAALKEKP